MKKKDTCSAACCLPHFLLTANWNTLVFFCVSLCSFFILLVSPSLAHYNIGMNTHVLKSVGGGSSFRAPCSDKPLQLAPVLGDHMVLQREPQEAQIWGWALAGANVTVRLFNAKEDVLAFDLVVGSGGAATNVRVDHSNEETNSIRTDRGMWIIRLPPQPAGVGHTLEISDGNQTIVLQDIAFGDVFACVEQSDLELIVDNDATFYVSSEEWDDSIHYPNLRVASVHKGMIRSIPQENVGNSYNWGVPRSSPRSLQEQLNPNGGQHSGGVFSASCYFFGRELYKALDGTVPIGLVDLPSLEEDGQRIELFSSQDAMEDRSCGGILPPEFVLETSGDHGSYSSDEDDKPRKGDNDDASAIWNTLIHPLLPMRLSGVVWSPGDEPPHHTSSHACRFPAMIRDWRLKFDVPDLIFVYVEPSSSSSWSWRIRTAHTAALQLPGVGRVTAMDLSGPTHHPSARIVLWRRKEVGRRLALSMLALLYSPDSNAEQTYSGPPLFTSAVVGIDPGSNSSIATLSFQRGTTKNLHLAGTADCTKCCDKEPPFEILTVHGVWMHVAVAQLRRQDQVTLMTHDPTTSIYGIRYAWQGRPECALYNGQDGPEDHAGLPASPFRWCAYPTGAPPWVEEPCHVPAEDAPFDKFPPAREHTVRHTNAAITNPNPVPIPTTRRLRLPTFVDNHMVLQRTPHHGRIWGWASPGAVVTATLVELGFQVATTAEEQTGTWIINFPPQAASEGHRINISDGQDEIVLEDIAFGDVFLCSGQSNMFLRVKTALNATEEIADAIHYPNIRLAQVALKVSDIEMEDVPSAAQYNWSRASPPTVSEFSAVCYFFGRELSRSLNGTVPIGLVASTWGDQPIENFSSWDALTDDTCGGTIPGTSDSAKQLLPVIPQSSQLWNAMIHPLRHMRFAGTLWYHGEKNARDAMSYACRFPAMIADWRVKFNLPDLTFLYVELAGYMRAGTWPRLRSAQTSALSLYRVGRATAIDLGDVPYARWGELHPRRKQEVGKRLAWQMRALQYSDESALWISTGPVWKGIQFDSTTVDEQDGVLITLSFESNTVHGLYFAGSADCTQCCDEPPFQVLTKSGKWLRVDSAALRVPDGVGESQKDQHHHHQQQQPRVIVKSKFRLIYGLRYAWEPRPECLLYNRVHVPAVPWEWCVVPTGQPPWSDSSCGGIANATTTPGTRFISTTPGTTITSGDA